MQMITRDGISTTVEAVRPKERPLELATVDEIRALTVYLLRSLGASNRQIAEAMRCKERMTYYDFEGRLPDLGPRLSAMVYAINYPQRGDG